MELTEVDPEVAAVEFRRDLDAFWKARRPETWGWTRHPVDDLVEVIEAEAERANGGVDVHYVRLEGHYYSTHPPRVLFVEPESWEELAVDSWRHPQFQNPPFEFGYHAAYTYPDEQTTRQLVCFSQSLDYYLSNHGPTDGQRWTSGRHTLSATLSRLRELLSPPVYLGTVGSPPPDQPQ